MPVQAHLAGVTQNLSQLAMRQRRKPHIAIDRGRQAVLDVHHARGQLAFPLPHGERHAANRVDVESDAACHDSPYERSERARPTERPHPDRNKPRDDRAEYPGELKRRRWPHARDPRSENQKRRDEERETPSRERM